LADIVFEVINTVDCIEKNYHHGKKDKKENTPVFNIGKKFYFLFHVPEVYDVLKGNTRKKPIYP